MYLENVHKARCFLDQRYVAPSTGKVTQESNESSSSSASGLSAEFVTLLSLPRVDMCISRFLATIMSRPLYSQSAKILTLIC